MISQPMDWPAVRAWRRAARQKLLAARAAMPMAVREDLSRRLMERLRPMLADRPQPISFYWPIKAEPDLKPLMQALDFAGIAVCLPVCTRLGEPLRFRPWRKGCKMERGFWDIPVPADPTEVVPRTLIAPIVGYAAERDTAYRLGYGGGFFDRTLAALGDAAQAIGVGFSMFRLPTIHPQAHDLPMAAIVTEADTGFKDDLRPYSEVCYVSEADASYAGFDTAGETAAKLTALRAALPPERLGLVDYALWRLTAENQAGAEIASRIEPSAGPSDAEIPARLAELLRRVRNNAVYAALAALKASLETPAWNSRTSPSS